jgi:hypothetical protein
MSWDTTCAKVISDVVQEGKIRQISRTKVSVENLYPGQVYCCPGDQGDKGQ